MRDGRDKLQLDGATSVEIIGLGQDRRVIFRSNDPNVDLFDTFVTFNSLEDLEFWLAVRVPNDDTNFWTEKTLSKVEYFLSEDFGFDKADVEIAREFGIGFPMSIPAVWNFVFADQEEEPGL